MVFCVYRTVLCNNGFFSNFFKEKSYNFFFSEMTFSMHNDDSSTL